MFDTHAHLGSAPLSDDVEGVLSRARAKGVRDILDVGTDAADSRAAIETASRFPGLHAAVGLHPNAQGDLAEVEALARDPRARAVGEIGLDYYHRDTPREVQLPRFEKQLDLALSLGKPALIHCREAWEDMAAILRARAPFLAALHCFSGGPELAGELSGLGFYISFAGPVTYARADSVREAARRVPPDRLLAETDSPYLAPAPLRGKSNEPANLPLIVAALAAARGEEPAQLAARTADNARRLLGLASRSSREDEG